MIADKHVGLCMYVCVCEKDQGANDGNQCVSRFMRPKGLTDNNYCFIVLSESYAAICI